MNQKGLRSKLARAYAAAHLKYTRESEAVSFFEEVAKRGPLLVIMPRDATMFEAARTVLPYLRWVTSGEEEPVRVHVYLHETFKTWIDSRLISHSISWADRDLNILKLPGNNLLNRVAKLGCDMAIDLNLEEDLQSAYICGITGAKVRIGMGSRAQKNNYNVEIHTPVNPEDPRQTYQQFSRQLHRIFFHGRGEYPTGLDTY